MTEKIRNIEIVGFQSHGETKLSFHPHLNIIVGPSDEGKSAILRAIKKVVRDIPSGNDFINHSTDTCKVVLNVENAKITRKVVCDAKGNTKVNEYTKDDVQTFTSFGREIPLEIKKAIDWPLIDLDDGSTVDFHFAGQHEQSFLISATPAVRSKVLGRVSGLHIIDRGIKKAHKDSRKIVGEIKGVKTTIENLKQELQEFPDVDNLQKCAQTLKTAFNQVNQKTKRLTRLKELENDINHIISQGKRLKKELEDLPKLPDNVVITLESKISYHNYLDELTTEYTQICGDINELENDSIIDSSITVSDFEEIWKKCEELKKFVQYFEELSQMKMLAKNLKNEISQLEKELINAQASWETYLKDLGVCPTCNQTTK